MDMVLPFLVFFPMGAGVIGYLIGKKSEKIRDLFSCAVTGIVLFSSLLLFQREASFSFSNFCGMGIFFMGDGFRVILVVLTAFIWFMTTLFSNEYFKNGKNLNRYYFFMLQTLGTTIGVFLSADFYTTFIFFEMMSFTSYMLVIHDETYEAIRAAHTYLSVAVIGGLVTLMGLFILYNMTGTLEFSKLTGIIAQTQNKDKYYIVGVLVLFGFGAKAGLVPMHIWLPKAHSIAPAPASAILSCILTKTGVYGVLALSSSVFLQDFKWGSLVLILGVITMIVGAVLAVLSINLKRTLACSSVSQIGFIMIGIGMQGVLGTHNALAAGGTLLHIINHSFIKLVLFISAGVIYMNVHKLDINEIRGYGKNKPMLKAVFLMGSLGITGIPLWNGYVSKTLLHESIVEEIVILAENGQSTLFFQSIEWLFLICGGLTCAYIAKIFIAIFVEKNVNENLYIEKKQYMSKTTSGVLVFGAAILPIMGILPHWTLDKIWTMGLSFMHAHAPSHAVKYLSLVNLKGAVISVVIGALVYVFVIRMLLMEKDEKGNMVYVDRLPEWLSIEDMIYRPLLLQILPFVGAFFARICGTMVDTFIVLTRIFIFNNDHSKVIPREDAYFSVYTHDADENSIFREGLAKSLLMFGVGVGLAMLYMLI